MMALSLTDKEEGAGPGSSVLTSTGGLFGLSWTDSIKSPYDIAFSHSIGLGRIELAMGQMWKYQILSNLSTGRGADVCEICVSKTH